MASARPGPSARSSARASGPARTSSQRIARRSGRPFSSTSTAVGAWPVTPTPSTRASGALCPMRPMTARAAFHHAWASASTRPSRQVSGGHASLASATTRPSASTTAPRTPVVPMSTPSSHPPRSVVAMGSASAPYAIDDRHDLCVREDMPRPLGDFEDRGDELLARSDAVGAQPVGDVGGAAHVADIDLLVPPEHPRGHAAINAVCEPRIPFLDGFDDRGGVDARRRSKGIVTDERVVERHVPVQGAGDGLAILDELREVAVRRKLPQEAQVEQDELHRGIPHAFADAERGAVDTIRPELERPEGVLERQTAIVVPVPVDADVLTRAGDEVFRELDEVVHAVRRRMTHGVRKTKPT